VATHRHDNVVSLEAPRVLGAEREPAYPGRAVTTRNDQRRPPGLTLAGAGVIMGIADWHCDFDHPNFKRRDGSTRLLALWDQRGTGSAGSPRRYGYGTVYRRADIDEALASADPYDALGYRPADAGHGTHVMDIAAGNGFAGGPVGIAPKAKFVFVHLANRGTQGLANLGNSCRLLEACDFIAWVAGGRPWVINLSLGQCGGPHDGQTPVELALDALLCAGTNRFVAMSGGNYRNARTHARGRLRPGRVESFAFVTDPADLTRNELEVWYGGEDEAVFGIRSPTGRLTSAVRLGERAEVVEAGRVVGRVYHLARDPGNGDNRIEVFLYPWAPAGRWTVTLQPRRVVAGEFHAWLERDNARPHNQARFVPADADPSCTTGTIANGRLPVVVGAYDAHSPTRPVAPFSSQGPTRDGRPTPHIVAPGERVLAARAAPAGSRRSPGLHMCKNGTSMAAPHVAGTAALGLQAGSFTAEQLRAVLLATAEPAIPPGDRTGCGYLDIAAAVSAASAVGRGRVRPHRYVSGDGPGHRPRPGGGRDGT
jgi:hypothetical protein